ncbi:hypothetical protein SPFL3102_03594 [Sporomusaceae bacterium FL31]|nr:hypothetical protein SPFL3101_00411 [Sporomusaceae bacterium FL31]GCE35743.1 hypothetical protein SPFL3102_03594 [Sporomusaceae bacterium]
MTKQKDSICMTCDCLVCSEGIRVDGGRLKCFPSKTYCYPRDDRTYCPGYSNGKCGKPKLRRAFGA